MVNKTKSAAIIQSSYIPWKGYFDIISQSDEFVLYDDVQYTKNDWRNRNRIISRDGPQWLTIPVLTKGRSGQMIHETEISDFHWAEKHWKSLKENYTKAPYFDENAGYVKSLYEKCEGEQMLCRVNEIFIRGICSLLGISTNITSSLDYILTRDRDKRLIELCKSLDASNYISGPAARCYLDTDVFSDNGISVTWMDYSNYKVYEQLFTQPFIHEVSIVDLLFNISPDNVMHYIDSR